MTKDSNKKKYVIARDKKHLKKIIQETIAEQGNECDLNFIDTSQITDMNDLFANSDFNGDISKWNTSKVTDMDALFANSQFNGDISQWAVGKVEKMQSMFFNSNFNGDISKWNIFNVKEIKDIFLNSSSQNIPYWAKIEKFQERQQAYLERQKILQDKQLLNQVIVPKKDKQETFKI